MGKTSESDANGAVPSSPPSGFRNRSRQFDQTSSSATHFPKHDCGEHGIAPLAPRFLSFPVAPRKSRHGGWPSLLEPGSTRPAEEALPTPTAVSGGGEPQSPSKSRCSRVYMAGAMIEIGTRAVVGVKMLCHGRFPLRSVWRNDFPEIEVND